MPLNLITWRIEAMKTILKGIGVTGLLGIFFVLPAMAQIANNVEFSTNFPFYVGNTKLPAGSYTIAPSELGQDILQIRDKTSTHTAFVDFTPTQSEQAHAKTEVAFKKCGTTDFLSQIWVAGQNFGMEIEPTKAQKKMAAASAPTTHSVEAKGH
jgi:hypothetical protein